ncbi:3(2)-5 -bisphosphate nucleotidase HAL2 [Penicillium manginii]|jgi:3'(2'), 5'-bisphosphate nucleotidase|uniref:3(2)-5 -bisphosphate nucleotidase HAL2 n=1 Tax=Penicillium manginii TaxID=203109 RepID=UPI0025487417|nr:3(2)-5 -bisphosphate nucleotidase HAL2 [Penicillium manginii]KAJ5755932.1 3(2)-5 -bisphosphate nucleotidase HAL2 [Penicillium manginii]
MKPPRVRGLLLLCSTVVLALTVVVQTRSRLALIPSFSLFSYFSYFSSPSHPITMSYSQERYIAELAVQRASILTQKVFFEKAKGTVSKDDKSPVTIGDFGAQALIIQAIRKNFPNDEIVAEEEASSLREDKDLSAEIWRLVKDIKLDDEESNNLLGGSLASEQSMLDIIDEGKSVGGGQGRIWALDPIDGTKGFLRGGQYAVCLGLIVDGDVKVGAIGTPNLPVDDAATIDANTGAQQGQTAANGVLFSAVLGEGATSRPLTTGTLAASKPISMRPVSDIAQAVFCEGVEAAHSAQGDNAAVAGLLGITAPSVRLDSQAKYCSIARGAGDIYLRLPVKKDYQEKIWDHAAGDIIVREAGGQVTDIYGARLDFSKGRTLAANKGVVAAPKAHQAQVIDAVKTVLKL